MLLGQRLKDAIHRLLGNKGSADDREVALDGVLNGNVVLTRGDRNVVVGGDFSGILVSGYQNRVLVNISDESYRSLCKKIFPRLKGYAPTPPSLPFIGRANDISAIKRLLIVDNVQPQPGTVIVQGWPGVGKTSLASAISRDQELRAIFSDGILWTALGTNPQLYSVLGTWIRALRLGNTLEVPSLEDYVACLQNNLFGRKVLLIVDDVWDIGHLSPFIRMRGSDCGLLVTTRLPRVATGLTTTKVRHHHLQILSEEDAVILLWALAPNVVAQEPGACRLLARDLERLPLALHVAGRLLRAEASLGWGVKELIKELRTGHSINDQYAPEDRAEEGKIPTVTALLKRSTDFLDAHTQLCFARLGLFAPKPASFDLKVLAALWSERDPKPFVRTLVAHGLLEPSSTGRFQMHALLVAHAKSLLRKADDELAFKHSV